MMFRQLFVLILFCAFPFSSWPLSLDWSGWSRVEGYYQQSEKKHNYYAGYHLVLNPKVHVVDGLNLTGRLDIQPLKELPFIASDKDRQAGLIFLYGEQSQQRDLKFSPLFLSLSQVYMDYRSEFFKVRLGRAPYHFGLGITHSASKDPFQHWMSVYNQLDLYLEYSRFYLQPALLYREETGVLGLAQAGFSHEDLKISALYQNNLKGKSFVEAFGQYKHGNWEMKASASYAFEEETRILTALEVFLPISAKIPFQLEVKAGGAFGGAVFHPNYSEALLFWSRQMKEQTGLETPPFQIAEGQMQNGFYFSPRLIFSLAEERLRLKPLFFLARDFTKDTFSYELDLEGRYQWGESFTFMVTGGALYDQGLHLALLTQAAVSF